MLRGILKSSFAAFALLSCVGYGRADCRPSGLVQRVGTEVEAFEGNVLTRWQVLGSAVPYIDSACKIEGSQALGLQGQPGQIVVARSAVNLDVSDKNTFSFWVHIDTPTAPEIGPSAAFYMTGDGYQSFFVGQSGQLHQGWNQIQLSRLDFQGVNNPSWNTPITSIQFRLNPVFGSTTAVRAQFDDLDMGEYSRPKIILGFDDCWKTDATVASGIMGRRIKGTIYAVSSFVGGYDRLQLTDLRRLYSAGWDICNHSATHPHMLNMPESEIRTEYQTCQDWLVANGFVRNDCYRHVAYPYGEYNENVLNAMENIGNRTARTTLVARQANSYDEPRMMYAISPDHATQRFDQMKPYIDKVIESGGCIELVFHRLVDNPTLPSDWRISDFKQLIGYIGSLQDQGLVDTCTISEWYNSIGKSKKR